MKTIPDPPPRLSTFKRRGGSRIPYAASRRPRSRRPDQRRSCSPAFLICPVFNQEWARLPSCNPPFRLSRAAMCPPSTSPPRSTWFSLFSLSTRCLPHVPFLSTSASHPKASSFLPSSSLLPDVFRHESSSVILLSFRHSFHALITRHHHSCRALILRAGLHAHPSSYSVIPGGSARSLPYPEMLSWPGRSQSQEAVIEAVGGG
jgi:hypothetical protein